MNIEELAFKDRKILANLNEIDLLDIIEFLQENKRLNGAIQTYDILLKSNIEENKKLKVQIEEYQKALDETMSEKIDIQKENKHLQERIEYLERSNNRREVTILEQRQIISDLEDLLKEGEKWENI